MSTAGQAGATPEQMLREFHASKAIHGGLMPGFPTADIPEWVRDLRMALLTEEVRELYDAAMAGDIVGIADGIADVAYVVTRTVVAYGIPFDAVFAEVHRSNMTKVNAPSEAKLVKGPGYEPPDIAGVLGLDDGKGRAGVVSTTGQAKPDIDRDPMWHRAYMDVQAVLDKALGTEEEDGAGSGIAGDVALLAAQRDSARRKAARLAARLRELTEPALISAPPATKADHGQILAEITQWTNLPRTEAVDLAWRICKLTGGECDGGV